MYVRSDVCKLIFKRFLFVFFVINVVYDIYQLEVIDPVEFSVTQSLKVNGNSVILFKFVTQTHILEKLLPWLNRLREADKWNIGSGKYYQASPNSLIDSDKIHLTVVEYHSEKYLALESEDQAIRQRIEIDTYRYHDQAILSATVYSRRKSLLFHYTVGQIIQLFVKKQLEKSLSQVIAIYEAVENELNLKSCLDFHFNKN